MSIQQFLDVEFRPSLINKLAQAQVPASAFILEVTESLFIEDFDRLSSILSQLRDDGFSVSLDDFGTGYSSLSVLRRMPLDEVKIDRSFVRDILEDEDDKALIRSIIGVGQSLNIPVLAEGVEHREQIDELLKFGCCCFQGYFYAKPVPKPELLNYLEAHTTKRANRAD